MCKVCNMSGENFADFHRKYNIGCHVCQVIDEKINKNFCRKAHVSVQNEKMTIPTKKRVRKMQTRFGFYSSSDLYASVTFCATAAGASS